MAIHSSSPWQEFRDIGRQTTPPKTADQATMHPARLMLVAGVLAGLAIVAGCTDTADTMDTAETMDAADPVDERPPNFVVLFADDLGYGDLGSFGHPTIKTPHLDRLAQEGLRLTQFYVAAPLCTPSRAALMTGRLPIRNGMTGRRAVLFPDSAGGLPAAETTLAEALKAHDYVTGAVGKWHLGHLPEYLPTAHGFDEYFGLPYSNDMRPEQNWDYARENFPPLPLMEGTEVIERIVDQSLLTERYTQRAVEFIEANRSQPFFLYLPYTAPHIPLMVTPERAGTSKRGLYGDVVEEIDWSVGQIVAALQRLDLAENTLVVFTSDNGPWRLAGVNGGSAGLLRGNKGSPWEGGFRVPTIVWMPGTVPANVTSDALGTTMDLFPTFLNMAGAEVGVYPNLDGIDITETFLGLRAVRERVIYYRQDDFVAYRHGAWKLFVNDPNPWSDEVLDSDLPLLYNLEVDPSEAFNVADEHPEVVERITALATAHSDSVVRVPSLLIEILPEFQESYDRHRNQ